METLLNDDEAFVGDYSFSETHPDAPNPAITVSGLGVIGIPLNPREAEVLKGHASQAPFGMADRTVVDTSVRNTWEIDSQQVRGILILCMHLCEHHPSLRITIGRDWKQEGLAYIHVQDSEERV